jgi:hypothetical protein
MDKNHGLMGGGGVSATNQANSYHDNGFTKPPLTWSVLMHPLAPPVAMTRVYLEGGRWECGTGNEAPILSDGGVELRW